MSHEESDRRAMTALENVGLSDARNRQVAAYSKGMRQRVKLAQATAHEPQVVILDEPLNGLDPLARAEAIALFEQWGRSRHFGAAYTDYILHGPGLSQLGSCMLVAALACVGYGAVFLMSGIFFRNPMIPAAVVMVWENLNPFLPTVLKKISVIFYLKNLCPVEIPIPPPFNVMVIDADPTPFWIAVPGLLALSLILLVYSGLSARHTEISYGE
jgi:hypothetical protein